VEVEGPRAPGVGAEEDLGAVEAERVVHGVEHLGGHQVPREEDACAGEGRRPPRGGGGGGHWSSRGSGGCLEMRRRELAGDGFSAGRRRKDGSRAEVAMTWRGAVRWRFCR
jgi:hypothetical protein